MTDFRITEADVGRKVRLRNGEEAEVVDFDCDPMASGAEIEFMGNRIWVHDNGSCSNQRAYPRDVIAFVDDDPDPVNHPKHYTDHPSGIECIQITEHMGFCLGNAVKYLWRADLKGDAIQDMQKAIWYIQREIERRKGDD